MSKLFFDEQSGKRLAETEEVRAELYKEVVRFNKLRKHNIVRMEVPAPTDRSETTQEPSSQASQEEQEICTLSENAFSQ